jgi:hypothetical protein
VERGTHLRYCPSGKVKHSSTATIKPLTSVGRTIWPAESQLVSASHRARHWTKLSANGPATIVTLGTMIISLFAMTVWGPRRLLIAKLIDDERLEHAVGDVRRKLLLTRLQVGSTRGAFGHPRSDSASARACRGQCWF